MQGLPLFAQINGSVPGDWWWSTLTSRPALILIGVALGCIVMMLFMGARLKAVSETRWPTKLREKLADDSGVAMIEFALVTPFLMFITLILIQTMLVFSGLFYVQYSAFTGVRSAIVQIPRESDEPRNFIMPVTGSDKYESIKAAVIFGLMPVCGREDGTVPGGDQIVAGVTEVYQSQDMQTPPWVAEVLIQRLVYGVNHTEVVIERLEVSGTNDVTFTEINGLSEFSPKEAISVHVRHEFALSIPLAGDVYALASNSGTYTPASRNSDSPGPPGNWTMIEARAILNNEGIRQTLPDAPPVPRQR